MKPQTFREVSISKKSVLNALRFTALLAGLVLTACATVPPEDQVRQRANDRWAALVAQNFDKAYSFAPPAYRQLKTADVYRSSHQAPVKWLSANVIKVSCESEKCDVRVALESQPMVPFGAGMTLTAGLDETWVYEDGNWWMVEPL